jgi:hydrogenase maturation protease
MRSALIIGFGNPLRGDDGLGWHAAQELRQTLRGEDAEVVACLQLMPELAEAVAHSKRAIFIDAAVGQPPGEITFAEIKAESRGFPACSHHLDVRRLMQYSRELYGIVPQAFSVSVNGEAYGYAEMLSSRVQSTLPAVLRLARDLAFRGTAS